MYLKVQNWRLERGEAQVFLFSRMKEQGLYLKASHVNLLSRLARSRSQNGLKGPKKLG